MHPTMDGFNQNHNENVNFSVIILHECICNFYINESSFRWKQDYPEYSKNTILYRLFPNFLSSMFFFSF